jgi:small nuclear ribonucleoprotein (snRNP)-like protein
MHVLVTLKTRETYAGILYAADDRTLVLRQCHAVAAGERNENVPLDGELIILLADVAFIQRP